MWIHHLDSSIEYALDLLSWETTQRLFNMLIIKIANVLVNLLLTIAFLIYLPQWAAAGP
jgi:hypothetical protein